jgi:hypothetical protein
MGAPDGSRDVTATSATLTGHIGSSLGGTSYSGTTYWFEYGPNGGSFTNQTPRRTIVLPDVKAHAVSETISGLSPDTTYVFQVCAMDSDQSAPLCAYGSSRFTTASAPGPEVVGMPKPPADVGTTAASLRGMSRATGASSARWWFQIATSPSGTGAPNHAGPTARCYSGPIGLPAGDSDLPGCQVTGLGPNTSYFYKVCNDAQGKACGPELQQFATAPDCDDTKTPSETVNEFVASNPAGTSANRQVLCIPGGSWPLEQTPGWPLGRVCSRRSLRGASEWSRPATAAGAGADPRANLRPTSEVPTGNPSGSAAWSAGAGNAPPQFGEAHAYGSSAILPDALLGDALVLPYTGIVARVRWAPQ